MRPLDPADVARLISKLNEIEGAATRAQLHIAAGCPKPANSELVDARTYIGQALRIAQGSAQVYVPDVRPIARGEQDEEAQAKSTSGGR